MKSRQGVLVVGIRSKRGVSYVSTKSVHGAATARAMSLRTLSFVRAEFDKRVSPFMIALGRTVSTIVRLKISKMLVSGLPLPVRQRLLEALKQRASGIHDALFRPD